MAVENTYPTEFNSPIEVNGNKELGSTTVAGPFENGHTRIITDDPEEQSPDDQDRTAPTILDDPSMLENTEEENIPGSQNPRFGKQYSTTEEFNKEPMSGIRNIDTEPITSADPTSIRSNEPITNLDSNKLPLEIPINDPTLQNQHSTTKEFNEESFNGAENTLPIITEDVTAPSRPEEQPIAEIIPTESPVQIPIEEPNLENQHSIQEESSEKPITKNESMNIAPTISEDPTTLNNVEAKEEPDTAIIPLEPPVQIPISQDPNLADQYKAPKNLNEESTTETENINTEEIIVGDPTTLINTEPEEEPVTKVVLNELPVVNPTTGNPQLSIPEIKNINTEPTILPDSTTFINTEPQKEPPTKVISDESPVGILSNENSALPVTETQNINTEPTILTDSTTLINTEPEEDPAKEVVLNESPVVIPTTENSQLPITEIENINTEPTLLSDPATLINTEPQEEPATKVISDESPVEIPTTENPELPIPQIENINTEPTVLSDSTTLIDTEPNEVTEVILDKSPVGTSVTENPSLEKEYSNILTNSIAPETTKPQEQPITYIIPTESFSKTEGPKEPILEVERTVTEEFTKVPTIGTETIDTTSAILPDALISNMTVPRETNTGTDENEPLLERSRSEEFILHDPSTTPVLNGIITASKEDPEHNNIGSDEQIPIEYGSGESSNYDLNRMITTDPTSLISTNGESVLQNDSGTPEINTEGTFLNVITEKPDSRAMEKHSKSSHKHSQIIDKEDACNNIAQKESATTPKDIHMPSAISYIIDKIKQCLTKILNMLHH